MSSASILPLPRPESSGGATVREVVDLYLTYAERVGKLEPSTVLQRRMKLERFARDFGPRLLSSCRRSDLELWIAERSEWGPATRKSCCQAINAAFNWALKDERIDRNPFRGVTVPDGPTRPPMIDADLRALLRNTTAVFRRVLIFLRYTGARPGEMAGLQWSDLHPDLPVLSIEKHKTRKKTGRPRIIHLPPVVHRLLLWLLRTQEHIQSEYVFLNTRGKPWGKNTLSKRMRRLRPKAKVSPRVKLASTRPAFATAGLANGVDLKTMAELLGHTSTKTTEKHYIDLQSQSEHMRNAAAQAVRRKR